YAREHGDNHQDDAPKKTLAERLIVAAASATFFHDEQGEPWAIVPVGSHYETLRLRDRSFKRWLVYTLYTATGKTPTAEALSQALTLLEARAVFDGPQRQLACRVAWHGDSLVYDLADTEWRAITVSPYGWEIGQRPGIFRRGSNTAAQVEPHPG